MTHIQIEDDFFDHPKVLSVSKDAKLLSIAAICYAGRMLTDGFIPAGAVVVLAAKTGVLNPKSAVAELIAARLWEVAEGGYRSHDYLDYNTSAEKVRAKRDAARIRMGKGRSQNVIANSEECSREVRANIDGISSEQTANFADGSSEVRNPTTTTTTTTTSSLEPNGSAELETTREPKHDAKVVPKSNPPFDLLETLCEAIGSDPSVLSKADRSRQLGVAKRLVEGGVTPAEIRGMVGYLQNQDWLTGGIDLVLIEKQIGKWRLNGQPDGRASPRNSARASPHDQARRNMDAVQRIARGEA